MKKSIFQLNTTRNFTGKGSGNFIEYASVQFSRIPTIFFQWNPLPIPLKFRCKNEWKFDWKSQRVHSVQCKNSGSFRNFLPVESIWNSTEILVEKNTGNPSGICNGFHWKILQVLSELFKWNPTCESSGIIGIYTSTPTADSQPILQLYICFHGKKRNNVIFSQM